MLILKPKDIWAFYTLSIPFDKYIDTGIRL